MTFIFPETIYDSKQNYLILVTKIRNILHEQIETSYKIPVLSELYTK